MQEPFPYFVHLKLGALASHARAMEAHAKEPITQAKALQDQLGELNYQTSQLERYAALPVADVAERSLGIDPERLAHLRQQAERLDAQIETAVAEGGHRHELYQIAQHCLNSVTHWLQGLPDGTPLTPAPAVKLSNGGDHRHMLSVVRSELAEVTVRIKAVQSAAIPFEELSRRASAWIAAKAAAQRLYVQAGPAVFEVTPTASRGHPIMRAAPDVLALLCRLLPEQMHAVLLEGADAAPGQPGALSAGERAAKIADLSVKATALERQEEALVMALHDAGVSTVSRRRDCRPEILLGAVVGTAKQAAA